MADPEAPAPAAAPAEPAPVPDPTGATEATEEAAAAPSQRRRPEPIYVDLDPESGCAEIESLCMNCYKQGTTRLMLTRIPFFREVIVMAFHCNECGFDSAEIQSGATIQRLGVRYTLTVTSVADLSRTVVKADSASVLLPHLDFEIPAGTQRGTLNTIEGLLDRSIDGLSQMQEERRKQTPEVAAKIDAVIAELTRCKNGEHLPFVIVVDDPAGNSFIENPRAPADDPQLSVAHYRRSREQNEALCLNDTAGEEVDGAAGDPEAVAAPAPGTSAQTSTPSPAGAVEGQSATAPQSQQQESYLDLVPAHKVPTAITRGLPVPEDRPTVTQEQEVVIIPQSCPACSAPGELRSVVTKIPHFKEVVILAFTCERCDFKSNEVQASGAIAGHGTKTTLHVQKPLDMTRSFLKSDTCTLTIPELQLELGAGTLGSRFTTVEGIIDNIIESLASNPFVLGDSAEQTARQRMATLIDGLKRFRTGTVPFTIILDDPMSNSYIQNPLVPEKDPQLEVVEYELTWQQKEELGINDMRTDYDTTTRQYLAPTVSAPSRSGKQTATAPATTLPAAHPGPHEDAAPPSASGPIPTATTAVPTSDSESIPSDAAPVADAAPPAGN